ncbi:MAG: flagellar motor switch protein FliM [Thermovenabulum sp.]|uniref:flagellar motor switch protein FliM n=1 Tax=Thermovenabulum sp. TaxID=3100335 RepID=UPI003C7D534E
MSDILSQSEIDALIAALTTGEIKAEEIKKETQEKKIKVYDFKKPNKFSKEQLNTIKLIHENFGRQLITYFTTQLRTLVQISGSHVDQMPFSEFSSSIPNPSIIGIVDFSPLKGSILLVTSVELAFTIIDRLLGGLGEYKDKPREPTEIEINIITKVFSRILKLIEETWKDIIELHPSLEKIETNPQYIQLVSPNEATALVTFNIRVGKTEGLINICVPFIVIEPIMPKLSTKAWLSASREASEDYAQKINKKLENISVEVKAELGKAIISVKDFLNLEVGDVIQLDRNIKEEIDIYVKEKLKFKGVIGKKNGKVAVKVTRFAEERNENYG